MSVIGRLAQGIGRAYDYATPGSGTSSLTEFGRTVVGDGNNDSTQQIGQSPSAYEGAMYLDPATGQLQTFRNGQWTSASTPQNDSSPQVQGVSTTLGGGGSSTYDPETLALYDYQINNANSALGRLTNQRDIGYSNIDNSYNESLNKLAVDRGTAERDYNLRVTDNTRDYADTRANLRANAGQQYSAVQRLLGSAGAGRSSAAQILAPFAVGREAASRFGQVQDQFGKNSRNLDTSWGDTTRQYDEFGQDLQTQRDAKRRELDSGLSQNEASIRDQIAQLSLQRASAAGTPLQTALQTLQPQQSRINELLTQIDNLGRNYQGSVQAKGQVKFAAPELAQYNYSRFAAPEVQQAVDPTADYVNPFFSLIQNADKERKLAQ
jgi:hypothetical protein